VHFRIVATGFSADPESKNQLPPLYAGQPISALISIHTSFHWGTRLESGQKSYEMRFDIEEMVRDWLISGRKRGDFKAEVCMRQSD
jgi:trafficking protein particle complex subunit 10